MKCEKIFQPLTPGGTAAGGGMSGSGEKNIKVL